MSIKRKLVDGTSSSAPKRARLQPRLEREDDFSSASDPEGQSSSEASSDSKSSSEESGTDSDEEERPSFAQYEAESELESLDDGSEQDEDSVVNVSDLQSQLAGLPMGALLKAQRRLAQPGKKRAPAPLPVDDAPIKRGRQRANKSGRSVPRYADVKTDVPLPSFLTGPNAAQPGVVKEKREKKELHGRESRHGPAVMSSKRAVGRARQVVEGNKIERRDPRFDSIHGGFDQRKFDKAYGFLDEQRTAELADLRKQVKAKSNASLTPDERDKQRKALTRLESQLEAKKRAERERAVLSAHRREEKAKRADGKAPYHLKRSEERALLAKAREEQLESEGKLQKSMRKREKKDAQKEKKRRPDMRRLA